MRLLPPKSMLFLALALGICFAEGVRRRMANVWAERYAGSESCRRCHEREYALWSTGPHTKQFRAATNECQGALWAIGGRDVIQYLRAMPGGRLQLMPWSWDVRKKEWYNTAQSFVRDWIPGDAPLDWHHSAFTFQTSCMGCHIAPSWERPAVPGKHWIEPTISCEGCHGPLYAHTRAPHLFKMPARLDSSSCMACHAKISGQALAAQPPGLDALTRRKRALDMPNGLVMPEDDIDFTADGRTLGETYTWTQWTLNPCAAAKGGPDCLTCHTSSGRTRKQGSEACTSCHSSKTVAEHGRHPNPGANAPTCLSCHMPPTVFGRIRSTNHSFKPPDPSLAVHFGGKSACANCHLRRSEEKNAAIVEMWRAQTAPQ